MTKQRAKASLAGLALFLIAATLTAQVTEEWVIYYDGPASRDDQAQSIAVDDTGNVYVTGRSVGSIQDYDYATIKYNSSGEEQWVARYTGSKPGWDQADAIVVDKECNVYVTGISVGDDSTSDYTTVKYNSAGEEMWVARYSGEEEENDYARAMVVDDSGNVYVTGYSPGLSSDWDYVTIKYNALGQEQWVVRYNGPGNGKDEATSIALDSQDHIYVTGSSTVEDNLDCATVKYNSDGVEQWVVHYNGPGNSHDGASVITVDSVGNVYICGWSTSSSTGRDYVTIKYDSAGEEQWVAIYDGPGSDYDDEDAAGAIAVGGKGNVYVTGQSDGAGTWVDYATVKYDSTGEEMWVVRYNGPENDDDIIGGMALDSAANVYVTGGCYVPFATTIKYDSLGTELWNIRSENAFGSAIMLDKTGNVYITGGGAGDNGYADYVTIKYNQGGGIDVTEVSGSISSYLLEVSKLTGKAAITYTLPSSSTVSLKVYDVTGQLVETLVSGHRSAGIHTVTWDAADYPAGLYFVRLESTDCSAAVKTILTK